MTRGRKPATQITTALDGEPKRPTSLDAVARKEWIRLMELLRLSGNLSTVDGSALEIYCRNFSLWRTCHIEIAKQGLMVSTPNGYQVQNPYVSIAKNCEKVMVQVLKEFGMTPKSRKIVKQTDALPPEDDKWSEFDFN